MLVWGRKRRSFNSQMTPSLLRDGPGRALLLPMVSEIKGRSGPLCPRPRSPKSDRTTRYFMQDSQNNLPVWHGTTILTVRKGGRVVVGGDGQVSIGQTVIKSNAKKVRKLGKGDVIGGFAGATADAFTLFERLESK